MLYCIMKYVSRFFERKPSVIITYSTVTLMIGFLFWFGYQIFKRQDQTINIEKVASGNEVEEFLDIGDSVNAPPEEVLIAKLNIPWALDFLPQNDILITERAGRILRYSQADKTVHELGRINEVAAVGEGGLLGLALHPDFDRNNLVYFYYTYRDDGVIKNRVVSLTLKDDKLTSERIIIDNIPGASNHNGGRLRFGPDSKLYITTGDAGNASLAQNLNSLAGKILRLNDDGTVPQDNPWDGSPVYSYGHRNPQGLAWNSQQELFVTEHGPSALDEVNKVMAGKNYGWPTIRGDEVHDGMEKPYYHSGSDTWAPGGAVFIDNILYFAGLRGQALFALDTDPDLNSPILRRFLHQKYGRLRDVILGPDNLLYLLTSNRDGRGNPTATDDRLVRVNPAKLSAQ